MPKRQWAPSASPDAIRARAQLYAGIRRFLAERGVLEVDTPVLSAAAPTDPNIESLTCDTGDGRRFLATSPEFPMKRLLAAGSGPIYRISPVFRGGETGRWHEPEFRMLEWYRPGFDHRQLMVEVEALLRLVMNDNGLTCHIRTYREVFAEQGVPDVFAAGVAELRQALDDAGVAAPPGLDTDALCDLLMGSTVGPGLGHHRPCFVTDYPPSQAALARIRPDDPSVAERFELYIAGVEIANGFHELTDAEEQGRRFEADLEKRRAAGQSLPPTDEALLAALGHGLPDCAGVAVGLDRLLALILDRDRISDVIAFPADRA